MYTRTLVPLDGSKLSEQALPYARLLASDYKIPIDLFNVFGSVPPETADPDHGPYETQIPTNFRDQAVTYLEGVRASLGDLGVSISCIAHEGNPADQIIREAERTPNTLIAMATHGRSGVGRWVLGSVTDKVLLGTTDPLLITHAQEGVLDSSDLHLRNVMVPLDGSPLAEQVLPHVMPLAQARGLNVILVRVTPSAEEYHRYMNQQMVSAAATVYSGPYEVFAKEADAQAMQYLHDVKERLTQQGALSVDDRLVRGHAADAILDLINEVPDSLVALTTHGRSGVGRWVLGSVADRLIRHSKKPVLVVRAKN